MGLNPGSPGFSIPDDESTQVRKLRDQERTTRENAAARSLEASQIGKGGLRVTDGGSITVEAPGTIDLSSGTFSAANVNATSVNATNVTAGGTVQGGAVVSTGPVTAAGGVSGATGTFPNGVKSVDVYNRLVSGSPYKVQYVDNTGQMGYVPSSRRYKRDIKTAKLNVQTIMSQLRVVTFRYLNAVALNGNEAPTEWGVIAEEIHDLGLTWLVDYNEAGEPDGVKHERFAILLIMDSQNKQSQIDALDQRIRSLGG